MARPIVWQDVVAPNFGSSLAASAAAGNQIGRALEGIGDVAQNYVDQTKEAATRGAVADIMNSADPFAAARSAPKGWQIDPLAVQQAVSAQDQRNRANLASDASLNASRTITAANQAQLDDRVTERQASTMSSPMIDQIVKTGKLPSIDPTKGDWSTAAGNRAYKQVIDFYQQHQRDANEAQLRHLQGKALLDAQNEKDFLGLARDFGASVEGQGSDPATWDRHLTDLAKRMHVSPAIVDQGLLYADRGAASNKATHEEMASQALGTDNSYSDFRSTLIRRQQDTEAQKNAVLSAPINSKDPTSPSLLQLQDVAKTTIFKEGIPAAKQLADYTGMDLDDAQSRIQRIQAKYPDLLGNQAAEIALDTQDRWDTFFKNPASAPEAVAKARMFKELNKFGGTTGIAGEVSKATSKFDIELAKLPVLDRQLTSSARAGGAVPDTIIKYKDKYSAEDKRKQDEAAKATAAIEEAAAKALLTPGFGNSYPNASTPRSIYYTPPSP